MISCASRIALLRLVVTVAIVWPEDADAQYCRCECYRTPYGRECRRVCYAPAPPRAPDAHYTYSGSAQPPLILPPELLGLGLLAAFAAIVLALLGSATRTQDIGETTAQIRADSAAMRDETGLTNVKRSDLEATMDRLAHESFKRGRRDAEAQHRHG